MMKASKYNRSEIMKEAHRLYKSNRYFNWSFSKCLTIAWENTKARIETAVMQEKYRIAEEKRRTEYRKSIIIPSFMERLYANGAYSGD